MHGGMGPQLASCLTFSHRLLACLWGRFCHHNCHHCQSHHHNCYNCHHCLCHHYCHHSHGWWFTGAVLCEDDRSVWRQDGNQEVEKIFRSSIVNSRKHFHSSLSKRKRTKNRQIKQVLQFKRLGSILWVHQETWGHSGWFSWWSDDSRWCWWASLQLNWHGGLINVNNKSPHFPLTPFYCRVVHWPSGKARGCWETRRVRWRSFLFALHCEIVHNAVQ